MSTQETTNPIGLEGEVDPARILDQLTPQQLLEQATKLQGCMVYTITDVQSASSASVRRTRVGTLSIMKDGKQQITYCKNFNSMAAIVDAEPVVGTVVEDFPKPGDHCVTILLFDTILSYKQSATSRRAAAAEQANAILQRQVIEQQRQMANMQQANANNDIDTGMMNGRNVPFLERALASAIAQRELQTSACLRPVRTSVDLSNTDSWADSLQVESDVEMMMQRLSLHYGNYRHNERAVVMDLADAMQMVMENKRSRTAANALHNAFVKYRVTRQYGVEQAPTILAHMELNTCDDIGKLMVSAATKASSAAKAKNNNNNNNNKSAGGSSRGSWHQRGGAQKPKNADGGQK